MDNIEYCGSHNSLQHRRFWRKPGRELYNGVSLLAIWFVHYKVRSTLIRSLFPENLFGMCSIIFDGRIYVFTSVDRIWVYETINVLFFVNRNHDFLWLYQIIVVSLLVAYLNTALPTFFVRLWTLQKKCCLSYWFSKENSILSDKVDCNRSKGQNPSATNVLRR